MPGLPEVAPQHVINNAAKACFEAALPPEFPRQYMGTDADYGCDYLVITTAGGPIQYHVHAQLKGSRDVQYIQDGQIIAQPLRVSTINYLLAQAAPTMVAVCDIAAPDQPVYWAWLESVWRAAAERQPRWQEQETLTLRIPTANRLGPASRDAIAADVRRHHETLATYAVAARTLLRDASRSLATQAPVVQGLVIAPDVAARLERLGLAAVRVDHGVGQVEAFGEADQARAAALNEVKALLDAWADRAARERLEVLAADIGQAAVPLRARFWNCRGVLAMRGGTYGLAIETFTRAVELAADHIPYVANRLGAEYVAASVEENQHPLPKDWDARLDAVLARDPAHEPAIRLKALRLRAIDGLAAAEAYLRGSPFWATHRGPALGVLASLCALAGQADRALANLAEREALGPVTDPEHEFLRGRLLYQRAMVQPDGAVVEDVIGFGPAQIDWGILREAQAAVLGAARRYAERGWPVEGLEAARAAGLTSVLLGDVVSAENTCRDWLMRHPDASDLEEVLALTRIRQGQYATAVGHVRRAHVARPESAQTFVNLLTALLLADEHEELLACVVRRETGGFRGQEEETVAREFAAVSHAERGEFAAARDHVARLRELPGHRGHAVVAEVRLLRAEGRPADEVQARLWAALAEDPGDAHLLACLAHELMPPTAEKARQLIPLLEQLRGHRQLGPDELAALGQAYLLLDELDRAVETFQAGHHRHPDHPGFLFELAHALTRQGDVERSYEALRRYLAAGRRDLAAYRNLAVLARDTDRLEDAIPMFERALAHAREPEERAELQAQLWALRRRRGDPARDVLRHVVGYGGMTALVDPVAESRFAMMALLSPPLSAEDKRDPEIAGWEAMIRQRIAAFVDAHPRFEGLERIALPVGLSDEEQARWLWAEIHARSLPGQLHRERVELMTRELDWPLTTRCQLRRAGESLIRYYDLCVNSDREEHAIHLHRPDVSPDNDIRQVDLRNPVCVELTALLTLDLLGLLDALPELVPLIVLARGTRRAIQVEFRGLEAANPRAVRLQAWLRTHAARIRILPGPGALDQEEGVQARSRVWVSEASSIVDAIGDGGGESVLLAQRHGWRLYSDEAALRRWAEQDSGVPAFSTVGLLLALEDQGRIPPGEVARCLAALIRHNYRTVYFRAKHLHTTLFRAIEAAGGEQSFDRLRTDPVLATLLATFSDATRPVSVMTRRAVDWSALLVLEPGIQDALGVAILVALAFTLGQREVAAAPLWAGLIFAMYRAEAAGAIEEGATRRAWHWVAAAAAARFSHRARAAEALLWEELPNALFHRVDVEPGLTRERRDRLRLELPRFLPFGVDERIRAAFTRLTAREAGLRF